MTSEEYARLKDIVAGALSRPDADRSAYVCAQCGADASMREEAESLLAAALDAAAFYEDPTLLIAGTTVTFEALDDLEGAGAVDDDFQGTSRYAVRRRIGAGGMGIVYEVEDRARGQIVALKTLRRWTSDDVYSLKHEFRNLADVAHPNLVSLYDLLIDEGQCFFTMELVEGATFVEYVRQGASPSIRADRARRALCQLIAGVEELHRRALQHRDIKPSNVLVTNAGRVVLLDFGLTSSVVRQDPIAREIAGTPAYLSPEQCRAADVSDACDWYSVGATLYHALTGRLPFDGSPREVIERKALEDPPPALEIAPDTPPDLSDVCAALLHRDPSMRMTGGGALRRLSLAAVTGSRSAEGSQPVFVGREDSIDVLRAAFKTSKAGRSASVVIHGSSGIGKSALVQRFIDTLGGEPVLVLRSRCHEHESIPYKALDGVIDNIARHLSEMSSDERVELMPRDGVALGRLFPVMRALVPSASNATESEPILLRRLALTAFGELLERLGRRQPVVMDIDDFHWADADSVTWLTDLLRPPSPPSLLVLLSFRSEELDAKPFLRSLVERIDIGTRFVLSLAPLSRADVNEMIESLLPVRVGSPSVDAHMAIARASAGNPFLVDALARDAAMGAASSTETTLAEMLSRRLDALPPESRAFLEVLAICGRPMRPERIFEACAHRGDPRPLVARLRAEHLVRNSRSADRVEMYHDRVRETLAADISPAKARSIHHVMAQVLVAHGDDDPEALFEHYRAAGRRELAAVQAAAAAHKASAVLAFDLAAAFYREALDLHPDAGKHAQWRAALANTLENAGRPLEAAEAYLEAARHADSVAQIDRRRKAAELLLIGGRIDQGLGVIEDVLRTVGVPLARGHATALVSLALRRTQLRWRGLEFVACTPSEIDHSDSFRIDACWSIAVGLAMVDPLRAADFNVRQLLWALDVGDPYRIARAMALESGFSVIVPVGAAYERSGELSRRAEALAGDVGQHYIEALTSVWAGIAAFLTGRWKEATHLCGRAATLLRDHCTGVTWELNLAQNFFLFSLLYRGELREVASHLPGLLRFARERGNVYLELEVSARMSLVALAADEPIEAERRADEGMARWAQRGFQRPHYHHLLTLLQTRLYLGRAREAWELVERHRRVLGQTMFRRVQHTRIEIANYRARCALALAAQGESASRMRAIAIQDAKRIADEQMAWSTPFATLIQATVAHQEGDVSAAIHGLTGAIEGFTSVDMHLYAAACRRHVGALVAGERGRALRAESDRAMARQDIRNPTAFTRVIAPGFPD